MFTQILLPISKIQPIHNRFLKSCGKLPAAGRLMSTWSKFAHDHGLRPRNPSKKSGPAKTRRNRRGRWSRTAVGARRALRRKLTAMFMERNGLYWLSEERMELLRPCFPKSRGIPRVNDRVVLGGIIYVVFHGLRWCDAPPQYGPYKTLYNRWKRWSDKGIFMEMLLTLAKNSKKTDVLMIDATYIKVHRTACCLRLIPGEEGRKIGRSKGGWTCKLHIVTDADGRPILMLLTAGNVSDCTGADALLKSLPKAKVLLADRGYDSDKLREALEEKGIDSCIPPRDIGDGLERISYDKKLCESRNRIERCFGKLKDCRRVATRYDRCPNVFLSACALAAVVKCWLP